MRIIRQQDRRTYSGWVWIDAYELDGRGNAVARRELFVMPEGLEQQVRAGV